MEAVEAVYRARGRDFYRYALATTNDPELARDAVQEGFARALRARRGYRGNGVLDAWIARCVVNAARDLRRRSVTADAPERASAVDGPPLPDERLLAALRSLPARQREAIFLRFYLDLDYTGIAEALGIRVGTVSAMLHAARERLGRLLEEVVQ